MSDGSEHLEDFGPLIGGDVGDPRLPAMRAHVHSCASCRQSLEEWESLEALFRSPELEVPVPKHQWRQIARRIEALAPTPQRPDRFWDWIGFALRPAWSFSLVVALLISSLWVGLRYVDYESHTAVLTAIADADADWDNARNHENPFGDYAGVVSGGNPFEEFETGRQQNPFEPARNEFR